MCNGLTVEFGLVSWLDSVCSTHNGEKTTHNGFDVDEEQDEFEANQKMPDLPDMDSGRPIRRRKQAARPSDEPIPAAVVARTPLSQQFKTKNRAHKIGDTHST